MAVKKSTRRRERRQETRVDAKLSMRVEGAHDGAHAQVVTESQNISASGIYCLSSHFLPPLSKVQLTIVLPKFPNTGRGQDLMIKCEGIVVRCEPATGRRPEVRYQLACMFADLDRAARERIQEFVARRNLEALRAAVAPSRDGARAASARPARSPRSGVAARRKPAARAVPRGSGARKSAR
jgi:c-di-GMP-binding flagellar brake protein YcgR